MGRMGYELSFIEQIYYYLINKIIYIMIIDHPGLFPVLVKTLHYKEITIAFLSDVIYVPFYIPAIYILFLFYCYTFFLNDSIQLMNNFKSNYQLIVLDSIYNYIYCLKLLIDKKYIYIYSTFTNLNLKNYFIISGIYIYIFYLLNISEIVYIFVKSNKTQNLFYLNYEFIYYYNLQTVLLILILLIVILHGTIGLYMLFFDYLKLSSFFLWTFLIYITIIFISIFLFENGNTNLLKIFYFLYFERN